MNEQLVRVQVLPESKEERVFKIKDGSLAVSVRAKAERGTANKSVILLLQQHFGNRARVWIVSGHHSPHKIISVHE